MLQILGLRTEAQRNVVPVVLGPHHRAERLELRLKLHARLVLAVQVLLVHVKLHAQRVNLGRERRQLAHQLGALGLERANLHVALVQHVARHAQLARRLLVRLRHGVQLGRGRVDLLGARVQLRHALLHRLQRRVRVAELLRQLRLARLGLVGTRNGRKELLVEHQLLVLGRANGLALGLEVLLQRRDLQLQLKDTARIVAQHGNGKARLVALAANQRRQADVAGGDKARRVAARH